MSKKKKPEELDVLEEAPLAEDIDSAETEEVQDAEETAEAVAETKQPAKTKKELTAKQKKAAEKQKKALAKKKQKEEEYDDEPKLKDVFKLMFNPDGKKRKKNEPVVPKKVKRIKTDYQQGLSAEQVQERIEKGQVNTSPTTNNKTIRSIIVGNLFTFFNILCFLIAIALVVVNILYKQSWSNIFFMVTILVNIIIGIAQEIRAKMTIEKLSLLTQPVVKVVRDGAESTIAMEDVVLDDIIYLSTGKQIVTDCIVVEGNIEVNESVLTGESLPIKKKVGDTLLAGSFVVSGHCHARVDKVGANNYIQQLSLAAKKYRKPKSELFSSLKLIIKVIGYL